MWPHIRPHTICTLLNDLIRTYNTLNSISTLFKMFRTTIARTVAPAAARFGGEEGLGLAESRVAILRREDHRLLDVELVQDVVDHLVVDEAVVAHLEDLVALRGEHLLTDLAVLLRRAENIAAAQALPRV